MKNLPVAVKYPLLHCFGVCLPLVSRWGRVGDARRVLPGAWGCSWRAEGFAPAGLQRGRSVLLPCLCRAAGHPQNLPSYLPDPVICGFMVQ